MQIGFDEATHTYTLDGRPVPAVSKVLEDFYDFRFVDPAVLAAAADLGTKVHKAIELHELGTLKRKSLHPALEARVVQWERFKADLGYVPLAQEVRVASKRWGYAGTLDSHGLLMPMADGDAECAMIADIKNGSEFAAHKLQTAGYKVAAVEQGILPDITKRASVYLTEDSYRVKWHPNKLDEAAFLSLVHVHHWKTHHGQ